MSKLRDLENRVTELECNNLISWWEDCLGANFKHSTPVNEIVEAILEHLNLEISRIHATPIQTIVKKKKNA